MMMLTYKFRLLPTKRQHRALERVLEWQRQLYNAALEERIDAYRKAGISRTYQDQCRALTEWRREDTEARSIARSIQHATLQRLDRAFAAFYRRIKAGKTPGFPRFRGRGAFKSFGVNEWCGVSFSGRHLRFKGLPGGIRVHVHRPLPAEGTLRTCIVKRSLDGWHVCFVMKMPTGEGRNGKRAVGVDLGLTVFAALSDGGFIPSLQAARRAERKLRLIQRSLSRKTRGSRAYKSRARSLKRLHSTVSHQRHNHLHQASARLVRDYDLIAIERLGIASLTRALLGKHVLDASWGRFISILRYKAAKAGAQIIEVKSANTSQECSTCGEVVPKVLGQSWHSCPGCGLSIDRDLNAARVILRRAGVGPGSPNVADECMRASRNMVRPPDALGLDTTLF